MTTEPVPTGDARELLSRLWTDYVRKHSRVLVFAIILMAVQGGLLGVLSYLVKPLFDEVFVAGREDAVVAVAGAVFLLFTIRAIAGFIQRYMIVRTGLRVVTDIQRTLLGHLLTLDTTFFQVNAPGGLIERVRGDAQSLQGTSSDALITIGRDVVGLVSLLAVAIWIDWVWALLAFVGLPLIVWPTIYLQRRIRAMAMRSRIRSSGVSTRLDEVFHGISAIKVNSLEAHESGRFAKAIADFFGAKLRSEIAKAGLPAMIDLISGIGFLCVLIYGGFEIIDGKKTLGEFMSFFTAMALMFDPLKRLSNVSGNIQAALASLERLYTLFDERPTITVPVTVDPGDRPDAEGALEVRDVHFAYGETPVLNGLSFTAEPGKTTAVVGPSGAGKSTVFNLLTRQIDPSSGAVTIGGRDIRSFGLHALRGHFSLVSQDAALFDETLRDNIRLGRLDASDAEIEAAADDATVSEFAREQPRGLDTPAGPRGSNLSGGQRQRVAIARAFLRDTPVLLLDEPTSALDAHSEEMIQQALSRLAKGRTTLVIAHRLATIRDADKIVVMDRGQVVDEGTHEELIAREGPYAALYQLQFRDGA